MFAIIITEKGGTERREVFDKTEINVGRVQGNELMLPKGNVSKHHARLLYRDGRFIVTDLKSTNGTYVNGRKITQATIVREGDKIYIGDFILRLEVPQQAQLPPPPGDPPAISQIPRQDAQSADGLSSPGRDGPVSHYPLENDPDEPPAGGAPAAPPPPPLKVPAPPRLPTTQTREYGGQPAGHPPLPPPISRASSSGGFPPPSPPSPVSDPSSPGILAPPPTPAAHALPPPLPQQPPPMPQQQPAIPMQPGPVASAPAVQRKGSLPSGRPPMPSQQRSATPAPFATVDSVRVPAHRLAVFALVARIEEMLDLSSLEYGAPPQEPLASRLDRALREEAGKLKASGEISADVDVDALTNDGREELLGFGPIEPLMRDDDVLEIHIQTHSAVLSVRASGGRRAELPFASESVCRRVIRRLCWQGGVALQGDEATIERMLYGGTQIVAMFDTVATTGVVATIRKRGPAAQSLEDLVRNGVLSRAMATFFSVVVNNRRNILVVGPTGSGVGAFVGALASNTQPGERTIVVQELGSSVALMQNAASVVIPSPDRAHEILGAVCRLRPDRLIAPSLGSDAAALLLETVAGGAEGVIAGMRAPTLRQGLGRLAAETASVRGSTGLEAACELISSGFDLLVEFGRLRDGRSRVMRVAEPVGVEGPRVATRELFQFAIERMASGGAIEGSFHPAGVIPRVAEELTARGVGIESGLFRR